MSTLFITIMKGPDHTRLQQTKSHFEAKYESPVIKECKAFSVNISPFLNWITFDTIACPHPYNHESRDVIGHRSNCSSVRAHTDGRMLPNVLSPQHPCSIIKHSLDKVVHQDKEWFGKYRHWTGCPKESTKEMPFP